MMFLIAYIHTHILCENILKRSFPCIFIFKFEWSFENYRHLALVFDDEWSSIWIIQVI